MGKQLHDGFLGIRPKVWLGVLAGILPCALIVTLTESRKMESTDSSVSVLGSAAFGTSTVSKPGVRIARATQKPTISSSEEAGLLAAQLANSKARELYDCEPFTTQNASVQLSDNGVWEWVARRGARKGDFSAVVRLHQDGTVEEVDVLFLDSRGFLQM